MFQSLIQQKEEEDFSPGKCSNFLLQLVQQQQQQQQVDFVFSPPFLVWQAAKRKLISSVKKKKSDWIFHFVFQDWEENNLKMLNHSEIYLLMDRTYVHTSILKAKIWKLTQP